MKHVYGWLYDNKISIFPEYCKTYVELYKYFAKISFAIRIADKLALRQSNSWKIVFYSWLYLRK